MKTRILFLIFLLSSYFLSAQDQADDSSINESNTIIQKDSSARSLWNNWAFDIGGVYLMRKRKKVFDGLETEYNGRIHASSVTKVERISLLFNIDYHQILEDYNESFTTNIRSRLDYRRSVSNRISFGVQSIFETQSSKIRNRDRRLKTFGALKSTLEFKLIPGAIEVDRKIDLVFSLGPHYTFDGPDYSFAIFYSLGFEAYHRFNFGGFSLNVGVHQNVDDVQTSLFYMNPNAYLKIYKGLSFNFGANFRSFNYDIDSIPYRLKIYNRDQAELTNGISFNTFYAGFNFRFGSKNNNFVDNKFD